MGVIADKIRRAIFGGEVRDSIADGIEVVEQLREDYDNQVINAGNSNAEIVDARGNYAKLKERLDKEHGEVISQLDKNVQQLNSKINEVAITGTTQEVLKATTETYIQEKINDGTIANLTVENNSIDTEKTKFINKYENLFNKENIILDKFLGGQVGNIASEFEKEDFFYYILPCKKGDIITVSATSFAYLEMDNDNRILVRAGKEDGSLSNVTITIVNENTTKLAISVKTTYISVDDYMIVRGDTMYSEYRAYGEVENLLNETFSFNNKQNEDIKEIAKESVKNNYIDEVENLFNKKNAIIGKFLGGQVGSVIKEFTTDTNFFYYFLDCKKDDVITVTGTSFAYFEVDKDNKILVRDGNESTNVSNVTITITNEDTTRLAINARMTVFPLDKYMIVRGSKLPSNYIAYGDTITSLKENFIFNDKQKEDIKNIVGNSTYYVSPNGNDENDGLSKTTPFATFQKAIDLGAKNINAFSGEYKGQTLICSDKEELNIRVIDAPYEQATLEKPKATFINYDAIEVNAYENIYVATIPIQTGNYNKVFVTKELPIIKTGLRSESYNAILWEIDKTDMSKDIKLKPVLTLEECKSTNGTFFYDGNTSLYINPKHGTVENKEFRKLILETGIKIKLSKINKMCLEDLKFLLYPEYVRIENCNNTQITACEAGYTAYSGGFSTYNTNCRFDYCKGYRNTGDGFAPVGYGNHDFYNCQGFYNYDDGLSHHDNTTGIVVGGEYHHNAQKGVAPAHGAAVDIHNVIAHHNKYGIYSLASDETNKGKIVRHVGIVSYENEYGIRVRNYNVLSYNCKYINNTVEDKNIEETEFTSFTEL